MRLLVAGILAMRVVGATDAAILDDLQQRAVAALHSIRHATTKAQADEQRGTLQRSLELSLGFGRITQNGSLVALLSTPERIDTRAPAILIVLPQGPRSSRTETLVNTLTHLGFIVLTLDLHARDYDLGVLLNGVAPEGLVQHAIRSALAYLLSRPDVDPQHLGLVGFGFTAAIAAAINPQFSAFAIADATPDFETEIRKMHELRNNARPDPSYLIPGLLRYASTQEMLAMIAPRPALLINSSDTAFEYAHDLYSSLGVWDKLQQRTGDLSERELRYAIYTWLTHWLHNAGDLGRFAEVELPVSMTKVELPKAVPAFTHAQRPTKAVLASLLGDPLPSAHVTWAINPGREQHLTLMPQPGIDIPVTVFRPGPEGRDPEQGVLLAISDAGKQTLGADEVVTEAVRRGWIVWAVDPRGLGELRSDSEGFVFAASLLLGENFAWRQASDVCRILESVCRSGQIAGLYARGQNAGIIAAYVAVLSEGEVPAWIALRDASISFSTLTTCPPYVLAFNALNVYDLGDLFRASQRKVVIVTRVEEFIRSDW